MNNVSKFKKLEHWQDKDTVIIITILNQNGHQLNLLSKI